MFRLLLGRARTEPSVLGDELVYSGIAKGFALEGLPLFRGELDLAHSLLYPLVLGPTHLLAADGAIAFEATKAINAIVVASAAIPAYLLARRVAPSGVGARRCSSGRIRAVDGLRLARHDRVAVPAGIHHVRPASRTHDRASCSTSATRGARRSRAARHDSAAGPRSRRRHSPRDRHRRPRVPQHARRVHLRTDARRSRSGCPGGGSRSRGGSPGSLSARSPTSAGLSVIRSDWRHGRCGASPCTNLRSVSSCSRSFRSRCAGCSDRRASRFARRGSLCSHVRSRSCSPSPQSRRARPGSTSSTSATSSI